MPAYQAPDGLPNRTAKTKWCTTGHRAPLSEFSLYREGGYYRPKCKRCRVEENKLLPRANRGYELAYWHRKQAEKLTVQEEREREDRLVTRDPGAVDILSQVTQMFDTTAELEAILGMASGTLRARLNGRVSIGYHHLDAALLILGQTWRMGEFEFYEL